VIIYEGIRPATINGHTRPPQKEKRPSIDLQTSTLKRGRAFRLDKCIVHRDRSGCHKPSSRFVQGEGSALIHYPQSGLRLHLPTRKVIDIAQSRKIISPPSAASKLGFGQADCKRCAPANDPMLATALGAHRDNLSRGEARCFLKPKA
jgi:hypothetical protein